MSFDGQNTTHLQVENVAGEICLSMNTITCNLQSFYFQTMMKTSNRRANFCVVRPCFLKKSTGRSDIFSFTS